jgi:predicted phage tail protein
MAARVLEMPLNEPQPKVEVLLEGAMGEEFGRKWNLVVNSPREALQVINANKPWVPVWIRDNIKKYSHYRVLVTYEDGREEALDKDDYPLLRKMKRIRFVPLIKGASSAGRIIAGIVLVILSFFVPATWGAAGAALSSAMMSVGASLVIGGIIQQMNDPGKTDNAAERKDKTSFFFDGPVNTTTQGVPVPLIYGRCLVGSHAVSASLTIDDITMYREITSPIGNNNALGYYKETYSSTTYTFEQLLDGHRYQNLQTGQKGLMVGDVWTPL